MPALISSNIIDAIHNIEEDTEGLIFHDFDGDRRRKNAVTRNFYNQLSGIRIINQTYTHLRNVNVSNL